MGTTSKGLRYPEGTVLANTLHTRIKELADDANTQMSSRDTRMANIETPLGVRGSPLTRNASYTPTSTNAPNDGIVRTVVLVQSIVYVPSNAVTCHVSVQTAAHAVTNAQCHFDPQISFNNGGASWNSLGNGMLTSHNQGNPALNLGYSAVGMFDVRGSRGGLVALAVNCSNDAGSGAWVHVGYTHWTITMLG